MIKPLVLGTPCYVPGDLRLRNRPRINRILCRYKTVSLLDKPESDFRKGKNKFSLAFVPAAQFRNPADVFESSAVRGLMKLAELHALDSLKRCSQCETWFFARFSHQQFCRTECRIKHNASSDQWKEYKRKKAREYYRLHKSRRVRERSIARRTA